MGGKTSAKSKNEWIAKVYDRINLTVPKGRKAELQAIAERRGQSVNGFINGLIDKALEREQAQAGVVMVSPGAIPDENICSRFISQWGSDFQSAFDASGQSAEEYIRQAVAERVERETRPPVPEWIQKLFPGERWPVIHVERDLPRYEQNQLMKHFTQEQKAEWEKEFRLELKEQIAEDKKNGTGLFATPRSCNLDI